MSLTKAKPSQLQALNLHTDLEHMDAETLHMLCDHIEVLHQRLVKLEGWMDIMKNAAVKVKDVAKAAAVATKKTAVSTVNKVTNRYSTLIINEIKERISKSPRDISHFRIEYNKNGNESGHVTITVNDLTQKSKLPVIIEIEPNYDKYDYTVKVPDKPDYSVKSLQIPSLAGAVFDAIIRLLDSYYAAPVHTQTYMDITPYAHTILQSQFGHVPY